MSTAKNIADALIGRAKTLQSFKIVRLLEDRSIIFKAGVIPFDLKINKDGLMTATVYAQTLTEAQEQIDSWLQSLEEDE